MADQPKTAADRQRDQEILAALLQRVRDLVRRVPDAYHGWDYVQTVNYKKVAEKAHKLLKQKEPKFSVVEECYRSLRGFYG